MSGLVQYVFMLYYAKCVKNVLLEADMLIDGICVNAFDPAWQVRPAEMYLWFVKTC